MPPATKQKNTLKNQENTCAIVQTITNAIKKKRLRALAIWKQSNAASLNHFIAKIQSSFQIPTNKQTNKHESVRLNTH
jgi:hypothetical protein